MNSTESGVYTRESPSPRYLELIEMYESMHKDGRPDNARGPEKTFTGSSLREHISLIAGLLNEMQAKTVLDFGAGKGALYFDAPGHDPDSRYKTLPEWGKALVTCYDPGYEPFAADVEGPFDGVISTDVIEHIPEPDIAWFLDDMFAYASLFVYVVAACFPAGKKLPDGSNAHCTIRPPQWWNEQLKLASARNPGVRWVLCAQEKSFFAFENRKKLFRKGTRNVIFDSADKNAGNL